MEAHVFIVNTFYQTSSFGTLQRWFWRNFSMREAPPRPAVNLLGQVWISWWCGRKTWVSRQRGQSCLCMQSVASRCKKLWIKVSCHL